MGDILYDAALKYSELLQKGYHIILGRKNKLYELQLRFTKDSFYHLIGLQHLNDLTLPSKNRERIFKEIINKKISTDTLKKSVFYTEFRIEERITHLYYLETMLDSCQVLFLINLKEYSSYTSIHADYLCEYLMMREPERILYYFICRITYSGIENYCGGCSFFVKHKIDYRRGPAATKILLNEKLLNPDTVSQTKIELFRNPNFVCESNMQ